MNAMECVISTTGATGKVYIEHRRFTSMGGRKFIPSYTPSIKQAETFPTKGLAEDALAMLRNPLERVFTIEPLKNEQA